MVSHEENKKARVFTKKIGRHLCAVGKFSVGSGLGYRRTGIEVIVCIFGYGFAVIWNAYD
jgi:hypothetical protein